MGRYAKEMAHVVGSAGSGTVIYTAPSGTAIGAARGARVTQVVVTNHAVVQRSYNLEHVHASGGASRFVIATVYLGVDETKIYNVNVVMQPGDQLAWGNSGADLTMLVSGEELTAGPNTMPFTLSDHGVGSLVTAVTGPLGTAIGQYTGLKVTWVDFYNNGTTPAKADLWANALNVLSCTLLPGESARYNLNIVLQYNFAIEINAPSSMFYHLSGDMYVIG